MSASPKGEMICPNFLKEKRTALRANTAMPLDAIPLHLPNAPVIRIDCWDISDAGMGFITRHCFPIGTRFAVKFNFAPGVDRLVLCKVCHSTPTAEETYRAGAEFLSAVETSPQQTVIPPDWFAH